MRHAKRNQRLSMPMDRREAVVSLLVRNLVQRGQIRTTFARAKEAQRLADRLVTLGKEGSIHSRRRAFRILQDRTLVKQLFAEIAPRYLDMPGGYTRVMRLGLRRGDGAQEALLALSRLPVAPPPSTGKTKAASKPQPPAEAQKGEPAEAEEGEKPKGLLQGLRKIWTRKKKGSAAS
jgi:large subunit ribosomal protein L17